MVWDTTQSTLYTAVERHNSAAGSGIAQTYDDPGDRPPRDYDKPIAANNRGHLSEMGYDSAAADEHYSGQRTDFPSSRQTAYADKSHASEPLQRRHTAPKPEYHSASSAHIRATEPQCENGGSSAQCSCPRCAGCGRPVQKNNGGNPLEALFSDRDSLLLAALIFVLLQEKADMKLIAALAFVLLT